MITSIRCMLLILASSYCYNDIMVKYREDSTDATLYGVWNMGFGNFRADSSGDANAPWCYIYTLCSDNFYECIHQSREISNVLTPALPQLLISAVYIAIDHQLTVMGWLVSQAIFPVRFMFYDNAYPYKEATNQGWLSSPEYYESPPPQLQLGTGYFAIGALSSIFVGASVFVVSLALGVKKCAPGLSIGPTNCLIIAAACHPPQNDRNAARKLVQWGVVQSGDDSDKDPVLHCTITSQKVTYPEEGRWYA